MLIFLKGRSRIMWSRARVSVRKGFPASSTYPTLAHFRVECITAVSSTLDLDDVILHLRSAYDFCTSQSDFAQYIQNWVCESVSYHVSKVL